MQTSNEQATSVTTSNKQRAVGVLPTSLTLRSYRHSPHATKHSFEHATGERNSQRYDTVGNQHHDRPTNKSQNKIPSINSYTKILISCTKITLISNHFRIRIRLHTSTLLISCRDCAIVRFRGFVA